MAAGAKILSFAGSTREDSWNKQLAKVAAEAAERAGAEVTYLDLREYAMPLYDGDLESNQGIPQKAKQLRGLMKAHNGLIIASPEYNSSISGVFKNTIDWVSRPDGDDEGLAAFSGKVAVLMSTSPGALGGLRGLVHLRSILSNIQTIVLPEQIAIGAAHEAFQAGKLVDQDKLKRVEQIVERLVEVAAKL